MWPRSQVDRCHWETVSAKSNASMTRSATVLHELGRCPKSKRLKFKVEVPSTNERESSTMNSWRFCWRCFVSCLPRVALLVVLPMLWPADGENDSRDDGSRRGKHGLASEKVEVGVLYIPGSLSRARAAGEKGSVAIFEANETTRCYLLPVMPTQ